MFKDTLLLSTAIFTISIALCYLPSTIKSTKLLKKFYPYITIAAAGFMLAMLLMDFIPHVSNPCQGHSHSKDKKHVHKHQHSIKECKEPEKCDIHKDQAHKEHESHDHSHKSTFMKNFGFFIAGLSFILLLGIDSSLLQHSHCDNENIVNMNDGLNHGPHQHEYCHIHCDDAKELAKADKSQDIAASVNLKQEDIQSIKPDNSNTEKDVRIQIGKEKKKESHTHHIEGGCNTSALKNQKGTLQAIIFIIALSLHSLFEGLAIKSESIGLFEVGIIIHKALESFALGFTISMAEFSQAQKIIIMTVYSILTPFGMFMSTLFKSFSMSQSSLLNHIITSTCNGLALGSILFIVCVEMIPPNFHTKGANIHKIVTLACGYLFTSVFICLLH